LEDPAEYVALLITHLADHNVPELARLEVKQERVVSVVRGHKRGSLPVKKIPVFLAER